MTLYRATLLLSLFSLVSTTSVEAQVDRSAIAGAVTDAQGNRIPQATVQIIEIDTGFRRETLTSAQGAWEVSALPSGVYRIEVTKAGFAPFTARNVRQVVGQTTTLEIRLEVAGSAQETTVTELIAGPDQVHATVGAAIGQAQITELPVNGRNWAGLTALAPGAIDNGGGDQRTIRFAGHGLDDNNLTLDGIDATPVYNQEQREYQRLNIPLDSIEEFQVQSQNFGADAQSGTAGGQVSLVSHEGGNTFHGDLFDYFRNDALDARSPFDGARPAAFLLNQFGAGLSGPVIHGSTFFAVNYEGLRQRLDGTQIGLVPSPSLLSAAALTSPVLAPVLNAFPTGTSATSNPDVWRYTGLGRQIDNEFGYDPHRPVSLIAHDGVRALQRR